MALFLPSEYLNYVYLFNNKDDINFVTPNVELMNFDAGTVGLIFASVSTTKTITPQIISSLPDVTIGGKPIKAFPAMETAIPRPLPIDLSGPKITSERIGQTGGKQTVRTVDLVKNVFSTHLFNLSEKGSVYKYNKPEGKQRYHFF